jgi:hypothetical protein
MSRFAQKNRSQPGAAADQIQAVETAYVSLMRAQRALVSMLLACAILGVKLLHGRPGAPQGRMYLPVIFATSLLTLAFTLRSRLVLPSLSELRSNPRDPALLRRWGRNTLIVQLLCAGVGLTGFFLQLIGSPTPLALALYLVAVSYLFWLRPVRPYGVPRAETRRMPSCFEYRHNI